VNLYLNKHHHLKEKNELSLNNFVAIKYYISSEQNTRDFENLDSFTYNNTKSIQKYIIINHLLYIIYYR
jgi:hypothetical protein